MPIINPLKSFDIHNEFGNYPVSGVACSNDGYILYACYQQQPGLDFIMSKNEGTSWSKMPIQSPSDFASGNFITIACGSTGTIIYSVCEGGHGFVKSVDSGLNWSSVSATGFFDGETGDNIKRIACDSTGTNLIASTGSNKNIYISTNSGLTWTSVHSVPPESSYFNVASNWDGSILYASIGNNIYANNVENWSLPINGNICGKWESITCDDSGERLFGTIAGRGLYIFSSASPHIVITSCEISSYISSNTNGNRLLAYNSPNMKTYELNYSLYENDYITIQIERTPNIRQLERGDGQTDLSCFKSDTKILTDKGYIEIQNLKMGDMVKTINHGYKPIFLIGYRQMYNRAVPERIKNQLYKCTNEKYPEIFEDLIITGCHSILVDEFKEGKREKTLQILHNIYITDNKYRLPACVDERTVVYDVPGEYTVYHIALENDDNFMNYGIYANGLLVESCSKIHLQDRAKMTLIPARF